MPDAPTRAEALRVLALASTAGQEDIKRAYRRLAREHHPDRGGDPHTFHEVTRAFERLVDDPTPPSSPQVSRGRPSRGPVAQPHPYGDVGRIDWQVTPPAFGDALDRDRLAVTLAAGPHRPVTPVAATSRAPGSRINRFAPHLAGHATAHLTVSPDLDDRGRTVVAVQLRAWSRGGRRALDGAELLGRWSRMRGSSSTVLRSMLVPADDILVTAAAAAGRAEELLSTLGWPLSSWTLTNGTPA